MIIKDTTMNANNNSATFHNILELSKTKDWMNNSTFSKKPGIGWTWAAGCGELAKSMVISFYNANSINDLPRYLTWSLSR